MSFLSLVDPHVPEGRLRKQEVGIPWALAQFPFLAFCLLKAGFH